MILHHGKQWLVVFLLWVHRVNLQMPFPMFMPPMPPMAPMLPMMPSMYFPPPPSPPIAFQIVQIQEPKKPPATERNEMEEKTIGIAIPMGFPGPMQFAMAAPQFPGPPMPPVPPYCAQMPQAPECPPYMRSPQTAPQPPQASFQVLPPGNARNRPRIWKDKIYDDAEFQSYLSESAVKKIRRRKRPNRGLKKPVYRTFDSEINGDFAKPVLSYISNNGDIKIERRLSDDEAAELMGEERINQKVQVLAEQNSQSVKIISSIENKLTGNKYFPEGNKPGNHRRRRVVLKPGSAQHVLREGKKELVFKPPVDKKISNLTVSFQIT